MVWGAVCRAARLTARLHFPPTTWGGRRSPSPTGRGTAATKWRPASISAETAGGRLAANRAPPFRPRDLRQDYNSHRAPRGSRFLPLLPALPPFPRGRRAALREGRAGERRPRSVSLPCWLPASAGSPPPPSAGATTRTGPGRYREGSGGGPGPLRRGGKVAGQAAARRREGGEGWGWRRAWGWPREP